MCWFALTVLLSFTAWLPLKAEGLSWTDPNEDKLCKVQSCSGAFIYQDHLIHGPKIFDLEILVGLYPSHDGSDTPESLAKKESDVKHVEMAVVYETADHVKLTYRDDNVLVLPLKRGDISIRTVSVVIRVGEIGVVSVLSINVIEYGAKNDIISRHEFR